MTTSLSSQEQAALVERAIENYRMALEVGEPWQIADARRALCELPPETLADQLSSLAERLQAAEEALRTYGEHLNWCRYADDVCEQCDCGYESAIRAALASSAPPAEENEHGAS